MPPARLCLGLLRPELQQEEERRTRQVMKDRDNLVLEPGHNGGEWGKEVIQSKWDEVMGLCGGEERTLSGPDKDILVRGLGDL